MKKVIPSKLHGWVSFLIIIVNIDCLFSRCWAVLNILYVSIFITNLWSKYHYYLSLLYRTENQSAENLSNLLKVTQSINFMCLLIKVLKMFAKLLPSPLCHSHFLPWWLTSNIHTHRTHILNFKVFQYKLCFQVIWYCWK